MENVATVLEFWFGNGRTARQISDQKSELWWSKNEAIDREIRFRFSDLTEAVFSQVSAHDWRSDSKGCLASTICLDQFPRNMYRETRRSFSYDAAALALAKSMTASGADLELSPIQRVFAYLPFEHSENIEDQNTSLRLYRGLFDSVDSTERELFENFYEFAVRHHNIIEQFGRFPHRNNVLGRESTEPEQVFLSRPGSSF